MKEMGDWNKLPSPVRGRGVGGEGMVRFVGGWPRSQAPAWDRSFPKLRFAGRHAGAANRRFAEGCSQAGAWEQVDATGTASKLAG